MRRIGVPKHKKKKPIFIKQKAWGIFDEYGLMVDEYGYNYLIYGRKDIATEQMLSYDYDFEMFVKPITLISTGKARL